MYAVPFSENSMIKIFSNILEWYYMNLAKPPSKIIEKSGSSTNYFILSILLFGIALIASSL